MDPIITGVHGNPVSIQKGIEDRVDGIAKTMRCWREGESVGVFYDFAIIIKTVEIEEGGKEEGSDEIDHQDIEDSDSSSVCEIGDEAVAEVVGTGCENQSKIVGEIIDEFCVIDDGLDIFFFS